MGGGAKGGGGVYGKISYYFMLIALYFINYT